MCRTIQMSANLCIYSKFNAPPKHKGQRAEQNKAAAEKNVIFTSEWRVFALLLTFFASYSFGVSPLFYFDIRLLQSYTTRAYFSHSFTRTIIHTWHGYVHLIRSFHSSHRPFTCALCNVAISFRRVRTHNHSFFHSGAVACFHTVCTYVGSYVHIIYTYIFLLRRFYLIKIHNTREDISFDFFFSSSFSFCLLFLSLPFSCCWNCAAAAVASLAIVIIVIIYILFLYSWMLMWLGQTGCVSNSNNVWTNVEKIDSIHLHSLSLCYW